MPFLLRRITKTRWYDDDPCWLEEGDLPADPLGDLRTSNNELSVWHVEESLSNLEEVAVAITCSSDNVSHFHYALIDPRVLGIADIELEEKPGTTPCHKINKWHRNLIELSASKLVRLCGMMRNSDKGAILRDKVLALLTAAVESGDVQLAKLPKKIRKEIDTQTEEKANS